MACPYAVLVWHKATVAASFGVVIFKIGFAEKGLPENRCQASAKDSAHQKLAAVLENVHAYYSQFMPLVDTAIKESLAPIEKRLEVGPPRITSSGASNSAMPMPQLKNLTIRNVRWQPIPSTCCMECCRTL